MSLIHLLFVIYHVLTTWNLKSNSVEQNVVPANDGVEGDVEYVPESLDVNDPALEAFSNVFARFQLPQEIKTVGLILLISYVVLMRNIGQGS